MKTLITLIATTCLIGAALGQPASPAPKPGPEHQKLGIWVGDWEYEGEAKDSPLGPGGKFSGKSAIRWILNGFFVECSGEETGPTGAFQWTDTNRYDPVSKKYTWNGLGSDGSTSTATYTRDDTTVSYTGTTVVGGKPYQIRGTIVFAAGFTSFVEKREYSTDGKTWAPWFELKYMKVKAAPTASQPLMLPRENRELRVLHLSGSGYERGLQHGKQLRSEIARILALWKEDLRSQSKQDPNSLIKQFLAETNFTPAIKQWTPDLLEEVRGIAKGSGQPFETMFAFQLVDEIWVFLDKRAANRCSSLGVARSGNHPAYVAQNMDLESFRDGFQVVLHIAGHESTPEQFVFTQAGMIALNGVNRHSIGIVCNAVMQLNASSNGLPVAFVLRGVLAQTNETEALKFVRNLPHATGQNYILGVGDRVHDFEASAGKVVEFRPTPDGSVVSHTNHRLVNDNLKPALSADWEKFIVNSQTRLASLQTHLTKPASAIDEGVIKETLRSKDSELHPVCVPWKAGAGAFTFGATIMTLSGAPSFAVTMGPPDANPFVRLEFSADAQPSASTERPGGKAGGPTPRASPPAKVAETTAATGAATDATAGSAQIIKFKPTRDQYYYLFGGGKPVLKVNPGDRLLLWTEDASSGTVVRYEDTPDKLPAIDGGNPQTGPFYVNGAAPGDTLALKIVDIQPAESQAWSCFGLRFGFMFTNDYDPVLSATVPELVWLYPVNRDRGTVTFQAGKMAGYRVEIPMHPFMGTIGTAPDRGECHDSMTARWSGGNMDCVETRAGAIVYLPVNVAGAMWSIGDCHLAQGDGETCGGAVECRSWVTVQILPLIKGKKVRTPRIENEEYLMSCGNARPLDSAYKIAYEDMVNWLVDDYGFHWTDAHQLMSQVSPVRVGNVVDPCFTVVVKFPKKYLPNRGAKL